MAPRGPSSWPWFIGLALALAACADSPPDAPPPVGQQTITNTEKACELLTTVDAEAILGSPIEDHKAESSLTPMGQKVLSGRCYYEGDAGSVSLSVQKHIDAAYASERFALHR